MRYDLNLRRPGFVGQRESAAQQHINTHFNAGWVALVFSRIRDISGVSQAVSVSCVMLEPDFLMQRHFSPECFAQQSKLCREACFEIYQHQLIRLLHCVCDYSSIHSSRMMGYVGYQL